MVDRVGSWRLILSFMIGILSFDTFSSIFNCSHHSQQVLAKPGSVSTGTKFEAEVYCLNKDEGGRHTPFFSNYRPQFFFRTADITGDLKLKEGTEMVMPGDNATLDVELITPIAIEQGLRFNIREGGRTVGTGVVSKVIE